MKIVAILPTVGRPELKRAVASVLAQDVDVHPIVVLDRPEARRTVEQLLVGLEHSLVLTDGGAGANAARNAGTKAADAEVVAYLDDDDEWLPEKTRLQLGLLDRFPDSAVTCKSYLVGRQTRIVPESSFDGSVPMADYLLARRTLRLRKNFLQSSSLLMRRSVALDVPWNESLPRHQDWAFFVDLHAMGQRFVSVEAPLVRVFQGSSGSISKSSNWRSSEDWLARYGAKASRQSQGDFLASIALRAALASSDLADARRILGRAIRLGAHPAAIVVGMSGYATVMKSLRKRDQ